MDESVITRDRVNEVYVRIRENRETIRQVEKQIRSAVMDLRCLQQNCLHTKARVSARGFVEKGDPQPFVGLFCEACDYEVREATKEEEDEYWKVNTDKLMDLLEEGE